MDIFLGAVVVAAVAAVLLMMWIIGNLFRRVGPNRALIVYGWGGTHIVTGGGSVVWPLFQSFQELSLELMSFDVAPEQQLYTSQGVAVAVEAVSQIKVKSDPESIRTAAEQFLTKPPAGARGAAAPGHGRPPARHRRPAEGRGDRQGARDRRRPRARQRLGRPEQDGP